MYYRNLVNICVQGSSANWKIRVVGNMQGKANACVCVWFKIETRRFKFFPPSFFLQRLRCLVDTISHLYLSKFTPGYMLAVRLFRWFSYILRTILICLTQKIVNYRNKQGTTTTAAAATTMTAMKKSARRCECINIRMCDFITQPVIECVLCCVLFNVQHVVIHSWLGKSRVRFSWLLLPLLSNLLLLQM